jgi:hypothetical protein
MNDDKQNLKSENESNVEGSPIKNKEITFLATNNMIAEEVYRQKQNEYLLQYMTD